MMRRCYDTSCLSYPNYGGRGITVCQRWKRFDLFLEDIPRIKGYNKKQFYNNELQLDKDISQKYQYSLDACEFITPLENNLHTRKQRKFCAISPNGFTKIYTNKKEASIELNVDPSDITKCLNGYRKHSKHYQFQYLQ